MWIVIITLGNDHKTHGSLLLWLTGLLKLGPDMWGVIITLGNDHKTLSSGNGSVSNTSSMAPLIQSFL